MTDFSRIAIIGLGLIGGSVALAARRAFPGAYIAVADADAGTRAAASTRFAVHEEVGEAVRGAELVVLAVPIPALAGVARAIAPHLAEGALVTDVASVKMPLVEEVAPLLPAHAALIPAHPIAGSERSGFGAAEADLFNGKRVILTPADPQHPAVERVAAFWRAMGVRVEFMPPDMHDRIYAAVSHLPQYLAFKIKVLLKEKQMALESPRFLRLGGSPHALWQGIFDANKTNISSSLHDYLRALHQIIGELEEGKANTSAVDAQAALQVFPRIAASCLVSACAMLERELGLPVARYAGSGFKDFTAPLESPPEDDLAAISIHAAQVAALLKDFAAKLEAGL